MADIGNLLKEKHFLIWFVATSVCYAAAFLLPVDAQLNTIKALIVITFSQSIIAFVMFILLLIDDFSIGARSIGRFFFIAMTLFGYNIVFLGMLVETLIRHRPGSRTIRTIDAAGFIMYLICGILMFADNVNETVHIIVAILCIVNAVILLVDLIFYIIEEGLC